MEPTDTRDSSEGLPTGHILALLQEVAARRQSGEELPDEAVCAAYPELMPALGVHLRYLGMAGQAHDVSEAMSAIRPVPQPAGPDDSIPGYSIVREIHRGGQGVVYQAVQKITQRKVAIKVMREGPFASKHDKARFEREVQVLAALKHPNIVAIHESGTAAGSFYFVMDYVSGQPLDVYMVAAQRSVRETLVLFRKICEAVNAAHLRGVIHRDLKPGNIRIDPEGEPQILDFGLAKVAAGQIGGETPTMTVTGQFVGSMPWASPEQAEGMPSKIDIRTDVYSLGVVLYQMLTGKFPYDVVGGFREVLDRIMTVPPVRPRTLRREIDDEVETIVLKALAKERERRYQSAGELARDIGHYLAGEPIEAKRDSTLYLIKKGLRRYRVPVAIAAGFMVLLAGGLMMTSALYYRANRALTAEDMARRAAEQAREKSDYLLYTALIEAAQNQIKGNQLAKAAQTLAACPPAYRHWEWGWLSRMATVAVDLRTLRGHDGPVGTIAFSRDSCLLASGGKDGTARIWDVGTGQLLRTIRPSCAPVECVTFSPDGRWLLTCGPNPKDTADGAVRCWDVRTGELARQFRAHDQPVRALAYSLDGKYLATGGDDKSVKLWDADTLKQRRTFADYTGTMLSVAFSSDGKYLVTNSMGRPGSRVGQLVRVLDVQDGSERYSRLDVQPKGTALDPQGRYLAVSLNNRYVNLVELADDHVEHALSLPFRELGFQNAVPVAFNPSGTQIAAGTEKGMLFMWQAGTWDEVFTGKTAHTGRLNCLAFSGDGRVLASAGDDGLVRLWGMYPPAADVTVSAHGGTPETLAFSPDGNRFAIGTVHGEIDVRDTRSGQLLSRSRIPGEDIEVKCVVFHPDGRRLAAAGGDGLVRLWDTTENRQLLTLDEGRGMTRAIAFSPDGRRLAIAGREGDTAIWDTITGRVVCRPQNGEGGALSLAFSHDGTLLAGSAGGSGLDEVKVWEAATGQLLYRLPFTGMGVIWTVLFSPDDKFLFYGDGKGVCHVLESRTGKSVKTFDTGHTDMSVMALSPDGQRLVTCGVGDLRMWDTASWQQMLTLEPRTVSRWCCFSPDGRTLGVAAANGLVFLRGALAWDARNYPGDGQASLDDRQEQYKRRWWLDQPPDSQYRNPADFAQARDLNSTSYEVVAAAGHTEQEYRKAYEQAAEACRLDPNNRYHLRTLGTALYRLGRYQEAVEQLTASNRLTGGLPSATSFLAMAYHRLGQAAEADAAMRQLRQIMKYGKWVYLPEAEDWYRQAREELGEPLPEDHVPGLTQSAWELKFYVWTPHRRVSQEDNWQAVLAGGPVAQSRAPFLRFRWGTRSPEPAVPPRFFATVATSSLACEKAGRFRVCVVADDAVRVWIDKQVVIDKFAPQTEICHKATVDLSSGQHSVRVEHFQGVDNATLIFWIEPYSDPPAADGANGVGAAER